MQTKEHTRQEIENNVFKENALRRVLNRHESRIKAALRPYIGSKAIKQTDGRFVKALADELHTIEQEARNDKLNPLPGTTYATVHFFAVTVSYSAIWLKISGCFEGRKCHGGGYIAEYNDISRYIGEIQKNPDTGKLLKVEDAETMPEISLSVELAVYGKALISITTAESENGKLLQKNRIF